ncbi:ABC transporter permease [Rhodobacteraceae bacterium]|nr:ABC transporter permease [Paracoccaceae bacterium]
MLSRTHLTAMTTLAVPVLFMLVWFVVPLTIFLSQAFGDPAGAFAPFKTLLGTRVYRQVFSNTLQLAAVITVATVLISYPIAFVLSRAKGGWFQLILYCVLFPLWVSVLVRTFSWVLILETNGPLNRALVATGIADAPIQLLFNDTGVFIGMVHVLTPYALLPIYTAMSRIDGHLMMASDGLGASLWNTFRRVYLPLTLPGVAGGAAFVFLLSLGFFITPAVLGGVNAISLAMLIEQFVNEQLNWVQAAAASLILLFAVLVILGVFSKFIKLGGTGGH